MSNPKREPANPWPPGHRQLTPDEFVEAVTKHQHNAPLGLTFNSMVVTDAVLLSLHSKGIAIAAIGPDGELAIQATKFALEEDKRAR